MLRLLIHRRAYIMPSRSANTDKSEYQIDAATRWRHPGRPNPVDPQHSSGGADRQWLARTDRQAAASANSARSRLLFSA